MFVVFGFSAIIEVGRSACRQREIAYVSRDTGVQEKKFLG